MPEFKDACNGHCASCSFPKDYPDVAATLKNDSGRMILNDGRCLSLWRQLEDGGGVPPAARDAVRELVMRG